MYLKLGTAQNSLGHTEAAILAWQKYLQLAPNGDMATVVKDQIDKLSKKADHHHGGRCHDHHGGWRPTTTTDELH